MNQTNIDIAALKTVSTNMNAKKEEIYSIYRNKIKPLISESTKPLAKNGLSPDALNRDFLALFDKFNNSMSFFIDTLDNKIIPEYENLSSDLSSLFNKDFNDKMSSLLDSLSVDE